MMIGKLRFSREKKKREKGSIRQWEHADILMNLYAVITMLIDGYRVFEMIKVGVYVANRCIIIIAR